MSRLYERLRREVATKPPHTQREALALAARHAIEAHGVMAGNVIRSGARGLARGLFGPAFIAASLAQRKAWVDMAEEEYRKAAGL